MFGSEFYIGFGIGMAISAGIVTWYTLAMNSSKLWKDGGNIHMMAEEDVIKKSIIESSHTQKVLEMFRLY